MAKVFLASHTLAEHLLRGLLGVGAMVAAFNVADARPLLAFALGVIALSAFRGCPLCWLLGLIETLRQKFNSPK